MFIRSRSLPETATNGGNWESPRACAAQLVVMASDRATGAGRQSPPCEGIIHHYFLQRTSANFRIEWRAGPAEQPLEQDEPHEDADQVAAGCDEQAGLNAP